MDITKMARGRLKVKVIIIVLAIPLVLGLSYLRYAMSHESTDDAFVTGHIVAVSPKVDGHIEKVYVNDNQWVEEGDLLAGIDTNDFQVSLNLAIAGLSAAQAATEQARAQVIAAEVEAKRTGKDRERYQQLFDAKAGITQQQLDNATAAANSATAQLEMANKQVAVAEAKISEAKAVVDKAQLNLSYTKITAPQSGRITNKAIEAGEYVRTGQPLMMVVPQEVWVVANFKETQLKYMRQGQPVKIKVDAYPQKSFKGHVDSIQAGTVQYSACCRRKTLPEIT